MENSYLRIAGRAVGRSAQDVSRRHRPGRRAGGVAGQGDRIGRGRGHHPARRHHRPGPPRHARSHGDPPGGAQPGRVPGKRPPAGSGESVGVDGVAGTVACRDPSSAIPFRFGGGPARRGRGGCGGRGPRPLRVREVPSGPSDALGARPRSAVGNRDLGALRGGALRLAAPGGVRRARVRQRLQRARVRQHADRGHRARAVRGDGAGRGRRVRGPGRGRGGGPAGPRRLRRRPRLPRPARPAARQRRRIGDLRLHLRPRSRHLRLLDGRGGPALVPPAAPGAGGGRAPAPRDRAAARADRAAQARASVIAAPATTSAGSATGGTSTSGSARTSRARWRFPSGGTSRASRTPTTRRSTRTWTGSSNCWPRRAPGRPSPSTSPWRASTCRW